MANDLRVSFQGAGDLYAIIRRVSDSTVWDGTEFEEWADGSIADYDIPLTDQGGDLHTADFPSAIEAGDYHIYYYERAGASPVITDSLIRNAVRYWNGSALSSSSSVSLSVYALATLNQVKQDLELTGDSTYDTALTEDINAATDAIERIANRQFLAREYRERFDADRFEEILLRFPVQKIRRISWGHANAFSLTYSGEATQASASIYNDYSSATSGGLQLQTISTAGTETTSDLTFASYDSVSELVDAVNLISGWTAVALIDGPSYDLNPDFLGDAEGVTVHGTYPDQILDRYRCDHKTGKLRIEWTAQSPWAWHGHHRTTHGLIRTPRPHRHDLPTGDQHILVKYRAGFATVPDSLNMLAREFVRSRYFARQGDPEALSLSLGPYSTTYARGHEDEALRTRLSAMGFVDYSGYVG